MPILEHRTFDTIISDAGRAEEDDEVKGYTNQAGYRLLAKVRKTDLRTPFRIYSTSNEYKFKAEIYTKFGQGSANDPIELFSLVISHLPANLMRAIVPNCDRADLRHAGLLLCGVSPRPEIPKPLRRRVRCAATRHANLSAEHRLRNGRCINCGD